MLEDERELRRACGYVVDLVTEEAAEPGIGGVELVEAVAKHPERSRGLCGADRPARGCAREVDEPFDGVEGVGALCRRLRPLEERCPADGGLPEHGQARVPAEERGPWECLHVSYALLRQKRQSAPLVLETPVERRIAGHLHDVFRPLPLPVEEEIEDLLGVVRTRSREGPVATVQADLRAPCERTGQGWRLLPGRPLRRYADYDASPPGQPYCERVTLREAPRVAEDLPGDWTAEPPVLEVGNRGELVHGSRGPNLAGRRPQPEQKRLSEAFHDRPPRAAACYAIELDVHRSPGPQSPGHVVEKNRIAADLSRPRPADNRDNVGAAIVKRQALTTGDSSHSNTREGALELLEPSRAARRRADDDLF